MSFKTRTFVISGPFGLRFTLQTQVPGKLHIRFQNLDEPMMIERSYSVPQPVAPPALKRVRRSTSEVFFTIPPSSSMASTSSFLSPPLEDAEMAPPSPTGTEIIECQRTSSEIVEDIQKLGVKVRDYANELPPIEERTPELFDPILALQGYEFALSGSPNRDAIPGKITRRLLSLGWINEVEERPRWQEKDMVSLKRYDERPSYPWKALPSAKPSSKEELAAAAASRYTSIDTEEVPESLEESRRRTLEALYRVSRHRRMKRFADEPAEMLASAAAATQNASPPKKPRRLGRTQTLAFIPPPPHPTTATSNASFQPPSETVPS